MGRTGSASPVEFNWWRQQTEAFEDVSAYAFNVANLAGESFTEQIPTLQVSAEFFRLCGSNALHGRTFTAGGRLVERAEDRGARLLVLAAAVRRGYRCDRPAHHLERLEP